MVLHPVVDTAGFSRCRRVFGVAGTRGLGADMARIVQAGDALLFFGGLGAGKTCLIQGLCSALDVSEEVVSPTFTLINRYLGRVPVAHLDFYRIESGHDLNDIGVQEILEELDDQRVLLLAEWPGLLQPLLPRRLDVLAVCGEEPEERFWYLRGVPELPAAYEELFPELKPLC